MNKTLLSMGLKAIASGINQIADGILEDSNAVSTEAAPQAAGRSKKGAPATTAIIAPNPPPVPAAPVIPPAPAAMTSDEAKSKLAEVSSTISVEKAKEILAKLLPGVEKPKFSMLTSEQYPDLVKLCAEATGNGGDENPLD